MSSLDISALCPCLDVGHHYMLSEFQILHVLDFASMIECAGLLPWMSLEVEEFSYYIMHISLLWKYEWLNIYACCVHVCWVLLCWLEGVGSCLCVCVCDVPDFALTTRRCRFMTANKFRSGGVVTLFRAYRTEMCSQHLVQGWVFDN